MLLSVLLKTIIMMMEFKKISYFTVMAKYCEIFEGPDIHDILKKIQCHIAS